MQEIRLINVNYDINIAVTVYSSSIYPTWLSLIDSYNLLDKKLTLSCRLILNCQNIDKIAMCKSNCLIAETVFTMTSLQDLEGTKSNLHHHKYFT